MVIELPPDFKEFLRLLNFHNVEYLLVGGFAVGFHGYPRATSDIDIWVGLADLKANKKASGRPKDLDDLQQLP